VLQLPWEVSQAGALAGPSPPSIMYIYGKNKYLEIMRNNEKEGMKTRYERCIFVDVDEKSRMRLFVMEQAGSFIIYSWCLLTLIPINANLKVLL
jgi:hypothetical protein